MYHFSVFFFLRLTKILSSNCYVLIITDQKSKPFFTLQEETFNIVALPHTCFLPTPCIHSACLPVDHPPAQLHDPSCLLFRTNTKAKPSSTSQNAEEQLVQMLKFWWERQTINRFPKRSALGQSYPAIPLIPLIGKVGECEWNLQTTDSWECLSNKRMGRRLFRTFEG